MNEKYTSKVLFEAEMQLTCPVAIERVGAVVGRHRAEGRPGKDRKRRERRYGLPTAWNFALKKNKESAIE